MEGNDYKIRKQKIKKQTCFEIKLIGNLKPIETVWFLFIIKTNINQKKKKIQPC